MQTVGPSERFWQGAAARSQGAHCAGLAALSADSCARRASIAVIVARKTSVTPMRVAVDSMSGLARFAPSAERRPEAAHRALQPLDLLLERRLVHRVDLRQRDDLGLFVEPRAIGGKLAAHRAVVGAGVRARRVDQMRQSAAALDMAEEPVAEAVALVRALDEAGNVGEHEVAPVDLDDAEARVERRERIIGDLGLGRRDRGEEGRFAGVRQADEAGVGDQLEPAGRGCARFRSGRDWRGAARGWSRW